MPDLQINHNFATIKTWDEAAPLLDSVLLQIRDSAQANPSLLSLVDTREAEPTHKAGDLVTVFDKDGNLQLKVSNGNSLVQINVSALSGPLSPSLHGNLIGGTLHAVATSVDAGFMSSADFIKLSNFEGTFVQNSAPSLAANNNWAIWIDNTTPGAFDGWVVIRMNGAEKFIGPAA